MAVAENSDGTIPAARSASERDARAMVERLQVITTALNAALTLQEAISVIVEQGVVAMQSNAGFLGLLTEGGRSLEMAGATGYDEEMVRRWPRTLLTAATPTADAVLNGEAIWLESHEALEQHYPDLAARPSLTGSRAFVALPLRADDRVLGTLGLSFNREQHFAESERSFMQALAQQCALALTRARLHATDREMRRASEAAQARLAFLARASNVLVTSLDYETTLRNSARQLLPMLADWCAIDMLDLSGAPRRVIVAHASGAHARSVRIQRSNLLLDEEMLQAIEPVLRDNLARLSPLIATKAAERLAIGAGDLRRLRRLPAISRIIVPLSTRGKLVGAITLIAAESQRVYGDDDLTLAEELSRTIALALENSRLYQAMQEAEQQSRKQAAQVETFSAAAQEIAESVLDLPTLLEAILRRIGDSGGVGWAICRRRPGRQEYVPIGVRHSDPGREGAFWRILADVPLQQVPTSSQTLDVVLHEAWRSVLPGADFEIIPLHHGEPRDILIIAHVNQGSPRERGAQLLLLELAKRAGLALDNNELHRRLATSEEHLRDLVGRLITAQEEERRRVAYDVHDGLAQIAVASHQHLQAYARQHSPRLPESRAALERVMQLAQRTVDEARQVIANLRPIVLDDFGLASALGQQVEELRQLGWLVAYHESLGPERLPNQVETALYRVAQEALNNVRKHAQTTTVALFLQRDPHWIRLTIEDQGQGFALDSAQSQEGPGERVGLPGMRERIALVGGQFQINSTLGVGTRVIAEVPL